VINFLIKEETKSIHIIKKLQQYRSSKAASVESQFWRKVCGSYYTLLWPLLLVTSYTITTAASFMSMPLVGHHYAFRA